MRKVIFILVSLVLLLSLTSCFAMMDVRNKEEESYSILDVDYKGQVIKDLYYGTGERNVYDLYLPEDKTSEKAKHLILFIHGGSWTGGDKEAGDVYCTYFSHQGYVSATMNYTLKSKTVDTNIMKINDEVKAAVTAIIAKCQEEGIGITLEDMAVSGFSAGACQAMMFGFNKESWVPGFDVKFIMQQSGPTTFDPAIWRNGEIHWSVKWQTGLDGSAKGDANWISTFSGKPVTEEMVRNGQAETIWREISPVTYITGESIPVLSAYGVYDGVVPPASRIVLEDALEAAGLVRGEDFDTFILPNSGHALACDVEIQRQYLAKVIEYCNNYFVSE